MNVENGVANSCSSGHIASYSEYSEWSGNEVTIVEYKFMMLPLTANFQIFY